MLKKFFFCFIALKRIAVSILEIQCENTSRYLPDVTSSNISYILHGKIMFMNIYLFISSHRVPMRVDKKTS